MYIEGAEGRRKKKEGAREEAKKGTAGVEGGL